MCQMSEKQVERTHKVTYHGTYFAGRDTKPYTVTIGDVPEEVISNASALCWFKNQLRNEKSEHHKLFVENHPDFEQLATYAIKDLEPVQ